MAKRRRHNPSPASDAAARERRYDAIQRRSRQAAQFSLTAAHFKNPVADLPLTARAPDPAGCCINEQTGLISCPGGVDQFYMHGRTVPLASMICADMPDGGRVCEIHTGDVRFTLPVCAPERPPPPGPPTPPPAEQECCYDVGSGTLRCAPENGLQGLAVSLIGMFPHPDGSIHAMVSSPTFGTDRQRAFPICDDPITNCCYDPKTETLQCPGDPLDGTSAGIVAAWRGPDGQLYVWASWAGGAARMPLCPGIEECPPVFCCINAQTLTYVCPGRPELNGQPAELADIVTENGYSWGVLDDGTRIPMCGEQCPPPRLCPECPTCPPGQWMSPDGTCEDPPTAPPPPDCPQCPPGLLLNTQTGECVECPRCPECPPPAVPPPPKKACCDSCARGGPCTGCGKGSRGHPMRAGPQARSPNPYDRRARRRKRRILSGN